MKSAKPFALLLAMALAVSSVVIAQDRSTRRGKLVKPWSELKTLSEEQKQQIIDIHTEALAAMRKIREKEQADIMALLTPQNLAELEAWKEKERAEQKARAAARKQAADKTADNEDDDRD